VTPISVAEKTLANEFDQGWFSASPGVGADAAAEFNRVAQDEYRKTGNLESAQKTALDMVKRSWGVSRIGDGSPRLMKYAPEKFYSVPGLTPKENADWMQGQLSSEIQDGGLFANDPTSRLSLINHPTAVSRDGLPLYSVVLTGDDGIPRVVTDKTGKPLAWKPDYKSSEVGKKAAADLQKNIDDARKARERILDPKNKVPLGAVPDKSSEFGIGLPGSL
jgi:hypothetical protein